MITKVLKTTDGQLKVSIPSTLSEITLGMLIAMEEDNSDLETISILSGIQKHELYNVRNIADLEVFKEHVLSLAHQIKYQSDNPPLPKEIFIIGKKVKVPYNISIEPAGAFYECRNLIADEINQHIKDFGEDDWKEHFKPSLKTSALILAHYLYWPATGLLYDGEMAEAFQKEVCKLSMTLALPIAKHFFLNYPFLPTVKQSYYKVIIQMWKRKLASINSRRLTTLTLLILWLTVM